MSTGSCFTCLEPRSNRSQHKTNGGLVHSNSSENQLPVYDVITLPANYERKTALPTPRFTCQLGYFEIAYRGSKKKNCRAGGLKLGYFFSFKFASFLSIQRVSDPLQTPKKILFINFRDYDILESNQYPLSTSPGRQQSNCFSTQLDDFNYFMTEKHPNLENWAYNYLIKIGLLCQFATVWCSEVLATLEKECKHFKQCMERQHNVWQHPKCGREKW